MAVYLEAPPRMQKIRAVADRVVELQSVANCTAAALCAELAEFVADELWDGWRSAEHWVCGNAGLSYTRAKRLCTIARRWHDLPITIAAFCNGQLTEDQVYPIARRAASFRDQECCEYALGMTVAQIERVMASLPEHPDGKNPDEHKGDPVRETSFGFDDDGWLRGRFSLPPDEGALVKTALERARDAVFHDTHPDAPEGKYPDGVTWADALVRLAEIALHGLDAATVAGRHPSERYETIIHLDAGSDIAHIHLGPVLPDPLRRYLLCDSKIRLLLEKDGVPVAMSIPAPTVDVRLRLIVENRDRGCRYPGCPQSRWLHIHHIVHTEHGGATIVTNLVALCRYHHHAHHHGDYQISGDPSTPDGLEFRHRTGWQIRYNPPPPATGPPQHQAARANVTVKPYRPPYCEPLDTTCIWWMPHHN